MHDGLIRSFSRLTAGAIHGFFLVDKFWSDRWFFWLTGFSLLTGFGQNLFLYIPSA
jgi:hypothetical protein